MCHLARVSLLLGVLTAMQWPAALSAATVTSTGDNGPGSLRQALLDASPGEVIDFAVSGTIGLTSGELVIALDVTLSGPGAGVLTIDGGGARVFRVPAGVEASFAGLTIRGGEAAGGGGGEGGGIHNLGTLTVIACSFEGNVARGGIGLAGADGGFGGGGGNGGDGITFGGTGGDGGNGGSERQGATAAIDNGGTLTLTHATVARNSLTAGSAGSEGFGGDGGTGGGTGGLPGVDGMPGTSASLRAANLATTNIATLDRTILASPAVGNNCEGAFSSAGHNLAFSPGDATCDASLDQSTDLPGVDPDLEPLALNPPGTTPTAALGPASGATDSIPAPACTVATDQRGVPRPQGAGCDIGAFEVEQPGLIASPPSLDFGGVVVGQSSVPLTVTVQSAGGADLALGQLSLTGPAAADFAISNDTCSNQAIPPNLTCTFDVTLTPSATGARNAGVDVPSNAATNPDAVPLTGTGLNPPALITSPASLDFGDVVVGQSSETLTVTIQSTGDVDLVLDQLSLAGAAAADFAISNDTCSNQAIPPNLTCTFDVTLTPSAAGIHEAQVDVPSNAATSPDAVPLTGNGLGVLEVPALGPWGLILLAALLGLLGGLRSRSARPGPR